MGHTQRDRHSSRGRAEFCRWGWLGLSLVEGGVFPHYYFLEVLCNVGSTLLLFLTRVVTLETS